MVKIDKKDQQLLELLQSDSRQPVHELAAKLGLPNTTVHNRIKRLEQYGIVTGYTARIDWAKAGKAIAAYVHVSAEYILPTGGKVSSEELVRSLRALRGVDEIATLTGTADALVKIRVKDLSELNDLVAQQMRAIPGVDKTQTMIVLSTF